MHVNDLEKFTNVQSFHDIIPDDEKYHGTRYYAEIIFDNDGKRDVTWVTTKDTKPGKYTIKVQAGDESDELTFTVMGS